MEPVVARGARGRRRVEHASGATTGEGRCVGQNFWHARGGRNGKYVMARRSQDWNEGLANDLQDPKFVREFLEAAAEDGIPPTVALCKVLRATTPPVKRRS